VYILLKITFFLCKKIWQKERGHKAGVKIKKACEAAGYAS